MSGRIVFADFDGVLNRRDQWVPQADVVRHKAAGRGGYVAWCAEGMLDPTMVGRLARLCVEGGARLVVSSGWRFEYTFDEIVAMLAAHGFPGNVPRGMLGAEGDGHGNRGDAIRAWLHFASQVGHHIERHVVLDDRTWEQGITGDSVIRTDADVGLTDRDVERALAILRGEHLHTPGWDANGAPVWDEPPGSP